MVDISPTRAAILKPEWRNKVPAPAYDSLTPNQRRQTRLANPWSFLNVTISPEDLAPQEHLSNDENALESNNDLLITLARKAIERITSAGAFTEPADCFFLYQLEKEGHKQTALVADVEAGNYESGDIRIHEQVQPDRATLLAEHMIRVGVISSPIAMTYRATQHLSLLFQQCLACEPVLRVDAGMKIIQTLWQVTDPVIVSQFIAAFKTQSLYIIDGHHRAAATIAANHQPDRSNKPPLPLFSALFPDNELKLLGFNRWIKPDHRDVSTETLADLPDCQRISHYRPPVKSELILYVDRQWLSLRLPPQTDGDITDSTDVSVLQTQLLDPVFGIETGDHRRIENFPGIQDHRKLCDKVDQYGGTAIFVSPLSMDQFLQIADTETLLPPKSTYFTPKVQSGIFLRSTRR